MNMCEGMTNAIISKLEKEIFETHLIKIATAMKDKGSEYGGVVFRLTEDGANISVIHDKIDTQIRENDKKELLKVLDGLSKAIESAEIRDPNIIDCDICGKPIEPKGDYYGGNNAEPIIEGRCCDHCDMEYILPARLKATRKE